MYGTYNYGNCGTTSCGGNTGIWFIVLFFLILFWGGGLGGGFGRNNAWGAAAMPWGNNEHTPKDNDARLADINANMAKDTAILDGKLDLGFRTVINNQDNNTNKIIEYQQNQYIKQLERQNMELFATAQSNAILNQMQANQCATNNRLNLIENNMLVRPPFYVRGCSPCTSTLGDLDGCGCGCSGNA